MSKFLFILFLFFSGISYAQNQIHIQYLNVRSPVANVYEDLYTDGVNVLSKQDGNMIITDPDFKAKKKNRDFYFISTLSNLETKKIFFTTMLDGKGDFFIYDEIPKIEWKIDNETTKKILGYECTKATSIFRGSSITAYFTKDIPYSIGPFKFYGLPGAILDIRVDNKSYDLWKAVKVDLNDNTKVNYQPEFPDYQKMKMKDFVELKDKTYNKFGNDTTVPGSTGKVINVRLQVEKIFEWETQPSN